MSTASNTSSGPPNTPEGAIHAFRDFVEERYQEWESEFGDDVHVRRTVAFDPKK